MKVVSTEALTKLIQLIKSSFISVDDTEQTSEIETETPTEITLATVATTGDYDDLINKPSFMPDYSAGVSVSTSQGNTYTVPSDGVIKATLDWYGSTVLSINEDNSSGQQLIYIWQQNQNSSTCYMPVSKDMVLYFTERNGANVQFYPYKGVQNA